LGGIPIMCPHCNTPVPLQAPSSPYCCLGCQAAHSLLVAAGLERFYELRGAERLAAVGARTSGQARPPRLWLEPLRAQAEAGHGDVVRLVLDIQGLQCVACVWLLERLFTRQPGAAAISINSGVGRMELCYRRGSSPVERFLDDAEALGYRAGPPRKQSDAPLDDLLLRLGLCAALAMNSMIFSFSQYFGLSVESDSRLFQLFSVGGFVLATACVLLGGTVFFRSALRALRAGVLHMDVPIALGIALTYLGSVWSFFFTDGRAAYFDTLCVFTTLMLLGRLLQQRLASRHRRILLQDDGVDGLLVRSLDADGRLALISATAIKPGQTLLCAPGELVPVRAELLDNSAGFSLGWVNGESEPASFYAGQMVPAGAHNQSPQAVRVRATEQFSASGLCQLLSTPSTADSHGEPRRQPDFWHVLSRSYVLFVLGLSLLGFLLWLPSGTFRALEVTVAVLVVTCPCALGVATPLAYELVQARLRRRGLFLRRTSFLDRCLSIRKVIFDKTGTLTMGELRLEGAEQLSLLSAEARNGLYQMVARSNHPVSRALLSVLTAKSHQEPPPLAALLSVREEAGQGLCLRTADTEYRLGRRTFALPEAAAQKESADREILFSCNGKLVASFAFREELCPDARAEVKALTESGYDVWMLSGDAPHKVADSGQRLGLPSMRVRGGLSPEQKAQLVRTIDGGRQDTLMIGDGVNDALAFAAAACAGTPAVDRPTLPERADFYFLGVGLGPISEALSLARRTREVIRRNLGLAALYNAVVLGLSLGGLMTPLRCSLAMPLSSIFILLATVHSLRERPAAQDFGSAAEAPSVTLPMPLAGPVHAEAQP